MTPARWQQVREVVEACLELEPTQRTTFAQTACRGDEAMLREVQSLLRASEEAGEFLEPESDAVTTAPGDMGSAAADAVIGSRIGPYRILEELGRGGMGAVYLAVRDDDEFQQQVAIKLVKRGMDTDYVLERFRYERQILAFLNHPNIARLLDGGSTSEGRPFFVMEYVKGRPILQYSRDKRLDLRQRVELFLDVCAAVSHAHANLVVHRDLKPSNIMITEEGTPKLLDFGIAKLITPSHAGISLPPTNSALRPFTPDYASPEQVMGDRITTATDVYSLGAVLYELLTGKRPHVFQSTSSAEIERVICRVEPERPSSAYPHPDLRGDLDNIMLKALDKDPSRRYATVEQFSADLRRFLGGQPVTARPDTFFYRASKFVRRNRGAVMAGAMVTAALVAGLAATIWQATIAGQQRDLAERRFEDVRKLANSFIFEFDTTISEQGPTAARALLVKRSLEYLDRLGREAAGSVPLQKELAEAYVKMGDVQGRPMASNAGDSAGALASYRKALAMREAMAAEAPEDLDAQEEVARAYQRVGSVLRNTGDYRGGLEIELKALAARERLAGLHGDEFKAKIRLAANYFTAGSAYAQLGRWEAALDTRRKALALYEKLAEKWPDNHDVEVGLTTSMRYVGGAMLELGRHEEAFPYFREALDRELTALDANPSNVSARSAVAGAYTSYAGALARGGRHGPAIENFERAAEIREGLSATDPKDWRMRSMLATTYTRIGQSYLQMKQPAEALKYIQKSLPMREGLSRENPLNAGALAEVGESYAVMGETLSALGKRPSGREWYQRAKGLFNGLEKQGRANFFVKQQQDRLAELSAR
ncbi:MAG: serine/threonine-protein kinase [Bryobacteraceae bacterium]